MKAVILFLSIAAATFAFAFQHVDKFMGKPGQTPSMTTTARAAAPRQVPTPPANYGSRSVTLNGDRHGHFQVDARVDGRMIDFMVDTGASTIALRESSAARLGIFPKPSDYTGRTSTANGIAKVAPVMLSRVEVNGITVRDVQAHVLPDSSLGVNLLGMSFLSRVKWTHDRGRLVLEQ